MRSPLAPENWEGFGGIGEYSPLLAQSVQSGFGFWHFPA
jgi:hypothetical protein